MHRPFVARCGRGVTLIEMCVVLGIVALLFGQLVPSMHRLRERVLLRATADALGDDLRLAREESVRLNRPVFFRISGKGAGACYLLHLGSPNGCDCAGGRPQCVGPGASVIKATWLAPGQALRLTSNIESMAFLRSRGSVSPTGSIEVRLNEREAIRVVVAITGRVRSCYTSAPIGNLRPC
ncbi:MAG: hypothetical protein EKK53_17835 [Burkholderiales bacterium]|nr:MAG: hypothetical protein EKK53_17835 [Burkholderiales bacterium]